MSTLSNLIFKNKAHKVSSPFGPRAVIKTSAGATSNFHNGVDYSTSGVKLSQYAIADGEIINCGVDTAYGNAKFVWIGYPQYNVKMLHYHLDSIAVKKGQKVKKGDKLGTTGKTGMATGIHLHLGIKKLSGGDYFDAEKWSKEVLDAKPEVKKYKYKITVTALNIRKDAGVNYAKTGGTYSLNRIIEVTEIKQGLFDQKTKAVANWGKTSKGWVCLKYCTKVS